MSNEIDKMIEAHNRALAASERVSELLQQENDLLKGELAEGKFTDTRAKEIALDAAVRAFPKITNEHFLVNAAQTIYEWLTKTDNP